MRMHIYRLLNKAENQTYVGNTYWWEVKTDKSLLSNDQHVTSRYDPGAQQSFMQSLKSKPTHNCDQHHELGQLQADDPAELQQMSFITYIYMYIPLHLFEKSLQVIATCDEML